MKRIFIVFGILLTLVSISNIASAEVVIDKNLYPSGLATANKQDPTKGKEASTVDAIRTAITSNFVEVVLGISAAVALFFILNNGFWMITSAGGEKIDESKKGLQWALIGLILIVLSYSIIRFIISIPISADERLNTPAEQTK